MNTENKVELIVLTDGQSMFLTTLSRAAASYRESWNAIARRGQEEIERMNNNQWVSGPSHQIMAEVGQEYGQIKAMLNLIWNVFSLEGFDEDDWAKGRDEVSQFIGVAMGEPKKSASITGGTFFAEGKTLSDYL